MKDRPDRPRRSRSVNRSGSGLWGRLFHTPPDEEQAEFVPAGWSEFGDNLKREVAAIPAFFGNFFRRASTLSSSGSTETDASARRGTRDPRDNRRRKEPRSSTDRRKVQLPIFQERRSDHGGGMTGGRREAPKLFLKSARQSGASAASSRQGHSQPTDRVLNFSASISMDQSRASSVAGSASGARPSLSQASKSVSMSGDAIDERERRVVDAEGWIVINEAGEMLTRMLRLDGYTLEFWADMDGPLQTTLNLEEDIDAAESSNPKSVTLTLTGGVQVTLETNDSLAFPVFDLSVLQLALMTLNQDEEKADEEAGEEGGEAGEERAEGEMGPSDKGEKGASGEG